MPVDEFRWAGPPPKAKGRPHRRYGPMARRLRQRPGAWAVIRNCPSAAVARNRTSAIRRGVIPAFLPAGSFEAVHREVGGKWLVYARFIGGGPR
jgi:hypothetical protein